MQLITKTCPLIEIITYNRLVQYAKWLCTDCLPNYALLITSLAYKHGIFIWIGLESGLK